MGTIKDIIGRYLVDADEIKKKNVWKKCTKDIQMKWLTMMVWSATQSQTFWRAKSSGA